MPLPGPDELALHADHASYDAKTQVWVGEGHAEVRGQNLAVRADRVTFDQAHGQIVAKNALMVLGLAAAIADQVTVDVQSQQATVDQGLFIQKRRVLPESLMQLTTPDA